MNTLTKPCALCDGPAHESDYCARCQLRLLDRMSGLRTAVWAIGCMIAVVLAAATAMSQTVVTPEFLDRIAWEESRNNPRAVGRAGELGAYQLKWIAVRDVNKEFGWRCRHMDAVDTAKGRAIARGYCQIIERRLRVALRRQPSAFEVYSAYRYGVRGWLRKTGR